MHATLADTSAGFGPPPADGPGILVAAPAARVRDLLVACLAARRFAVATAESGAQAFDVYFREVGGIEAVVVDVELADLPGLAFIDRFRRHFPGVPVFALTDDPFGPLAVDLAASGTTVLSKPVHLRQFADAVCSALTVPSAR